MEIAAGTPKEAAIKLAYDFARDLRDEGAREQEFDALLAGKVTAPFRGDALLPYLSAGFRAGFFGRMLPWVREVDVQSSASLAPPQSGEGNGDGPSSGRH